MFIWNLGPHEHDVFVNRRTTRERKKIKAFAVPVRGDIKSQDFRIEHKEMEYRQTNSGNGHEEDDGRSKLLSTSWVVSNTLNLTHHQNLWDWCVNNVTDIILGSWDSDCVLRARFTRIFFTVRGRFTVIFTKFRQVHTRQINVLDLTGIFKIW